LSANLAPGLHVPAGRPADVSAYEGWTGRWSRLFVPAVVSAANVAPGSRVLDVCTGTGEAALGMLPIIGESGILIGVDIAPAMVTAARSRLKNRAFVPVAADGQRLPFKDGSFDAAVCQLGLQFFPDPLRGLTEFHRVLRKGCRAAICVISTPDRAPMWGVLADTISRYVPEQRDLLHLSFALSDAGRLERMFLAAGFHDVRIERKEEQDTSDSFDDYWNPIETGMGSMPQVYMSLREAERILVREEAKDQLSRFEINGKLVMSVEMLIAVGTA
jgi:ubiquinone/menaquinone biosynthesis C-methylase UbiE